MLYVRFLLAWFLQVCATQQAFDSFSDGAHSVPWVRRYEKELPLEAYLDDYMNVSAGVPFRHVGMSYDYPCFFLHQRKTGGTSLRASLVAGFRALGVSDFTIACYGGVLCPQYTINPNVPRRSRFYAMHSSWNTLWPLFQPAEIGAPERNVGKVNFTCFSVFREPISRVVSCFYFRFKSTLNGTCINELSVSEFTKMIVTGKDAYGDGCLNEPFRVFSSLRMHIDETHINRLGLMHYGSKLPQAHTATLEGAQQEWNVYPQIKEHDVVALRDSLDHLSNCVPLVDEIPESMNLMEYLAPQLYHKGGFNISSIHLQEHYNISATCAPPDEARYEVLYNVTRLETILYDTVVAKVKQLMTQTIT